MANIALLNRCNLKCPYCFANDYTSSKKQDIDVNSFKALLDFCAPDREVGLIGGEPLLHPNLDTFLDILSYDMRFMRVTIFTNGVYLSKHISSLLNPKFIILVNVNSRKIMGSDAFDKMELGIDLLVQSGMRENVTLGINVYEENQDFSELLYLVKKYGFNKVRLSVVIPNDKSKGGIPYFYKMKPTLFGLYEELKKLGCAPCYDCNAIPECVYTSKEKQLLASLPFTNNYEREIFMGKRSVCSPVIDLYPDGTATRCFGCYDALKVRYDEFESISDLKNFFFMQIDSRLVHNFSREECKDCYKHKTFGCFGGCLCYK